jgi:Asp-tRNA(Asn)/Glu-tRNA(Gln) amidotransferase A subunit family amidase
LPNCANTFIDNPAEVDGTPISVMLLGRKNGEVDLLQTAGFVVQALSKNTN